MNGLSRSAGVSSAKMNGVEYRIRGKTLAFYADMEARIAKLRGDPVEKIIEAAKQANLQDNPKILTDVASVIVERFRNWGVATYSDYLEYGNSPDADALTIWHCIHQDHPNVTLEDVKLYVIRTKFKGLDDPAAKEEIQNVFKAIAVASGEDSVGNSNGQPAEVPATIQ